jgi:ACR3 family arsenite transporter
MTRARNPQAVQAGGTLNAFEKYLTLWVALCIVAGILLGRFFPGVAQTLDAWSAYSSHK